MRLTCAVPYLATSAISPSTIAGRALSASIRTASLSWAMAGSGGVGMVPMVTPSAGWSRRERGRSLFLIRAVAAQALVASLEQVGDRHCRELVELVQQHGFQ